MIDLKKLFQTDTQSGPDTELETRDALQRGLDEEYSELIAEQLLRGGIEASCVSIELKKVGHARDGLPVYLGMLRLVRWERRSALRLLLGLPILEAKLRRLTVGSWLQDVSHFGGLWLHASGQLQGSTAMHELRSLVMDIERNDSNPPSEREDPWSLPTDMGKLA